MIRINLLPVDRERRKKRSFSIGTQTQRLTILCTLILAAAIGSSGWRYWTIWRKSRALDQEISAAQQVTTRLHSIILQVQQFEQRKAQLQQRVVLIEQLRKGQTGPVRMLDVISRALPPMLWLTELKQTGGDVLIEGRCTSLTGLSDLVANLEATGFFKRSVEIVASQTEPIPQPPGELVKFSVKAQLLVAPPAPKSAGPPASAKPGGVAPGPPAKPGGIGSAVGKVGAP